MIKVLFRNKQKVSIFMAEEDAKFLKKAAIDKGVSLSAFLVNAGLASTEICKHSYVDTEQVCILCGHRFTKDEMNDHCRLYPKDMVCQMVRNQLVKLK